MDIASRPRRSNGLGAAPGENWVGASDSGWGMESVAGVARSPGWGAAGGGGGSGVGAWDWGGGRGGGGGLPRPRGGASAGAGERVLQRPPAGLCGRAQDPGRTAGAERSPAARVEPVLLPAAAGRAPCVVVP